MAENESEKERRDRELIELLNELRVALPGVQVLFAFLLAVPFTQRFPDVTELQKTVYFASVLLTAAATALLIAPSAYHRLRFRQRDKEQMLVTGNRLSIAGMACLALAMVAVVFLITDVLYTGWIVAVVSVVTTLAFAWFWYGLPILRRVDDESG